MIKTKLLVLGTLGLCTMVSAQQPDGSIPPPPLVTMAWRHTIAGPCQAGEMDVDGRGYNYLFYIRQNGAGGIGYLQKLGPANSLEFENVVEFIPNSVFWLPIGVVINPRITSATVQNPYVISTVVLPTSSYLRLYKYNTAGTLLSGPYDLNQALNNYYVAAAATDTDLYLVADGANATGHELDLYDFNGNSAALISIAGFQPAEAKYDRASNSWFIAGIDATDPNGLGAVWGSYNATTGVKNFGGSIPGSGTPAGAYTQMRYTIDLLPGNRFALSTNETDNNGAGTTTSSYQITYGNTANGQTVWTMPAGLHQNSGTVTQIVQPKDTTNLYALGLADSAPAGFPLQTLSAYSSGGALIFNHVQQPIERMFPVSDGFWSLLNWPSSNSIFLEHFYDQLNTFDWGKQYAPTAPTSYFYGRLTSFQNWVYVLKDNAGGGGNDLWIDRFVQGCTIKDISVASSFVGGNQLPVTIDLNEAVPSGQTLTVALTSFNPNVTMPDSTTSENFTLTQGQTQLVVNLNTVGTGGNYNVVLLGMNQGVRRYGYTQGTP